MLLLLGQNHFSVEKMLAFDVFNECVTDRPTDRPTDTAYYRDARTHLKTRISPSLFCNFKNSILITLVILYSEPRMRIGESSASFLGLKKIPIIIQGRICFASLNKC